MLANNFILLAMQLLKEKNLQTTLFTGKLQNQWYCICIGKLLSKVHLGMKLGRGKLSFIDKEKITVKSSSENELHLDCI
jgi:hypothetical protein